MVWGLNSGVEEIFCAIQTGHKACCTMGSGSFAGVNWPECGAVHLPPSAGLQMGWIYTIASPLCLHGHVTCRTHCLRIIPGRMLSQIIIRIFQEAKMLDLEN
jgi:hypothetical protein